MNKAKLWTAVVSVVVVSACGGTNFQGGLDGDGGTGAGTGTGAGSGSGTGGSGGSNTSAYTGLPCDVAQVLASKCGACHGPGTTQAPPLVTLADLTSGTVADRVLARMKDAASPMPPAYAGNPVSAADIAAIQAWVTAGKQAGTCSAGIDAGTPGPQPTTCASNNFWTFGNSGDPDMNPGRPCAACHRSSGEGPTTRYMGTAFPALHEKDRCNASPPGNATVEILNASGAVIDTLPISTLSGNFYSLRSGAAGSYRARVMVNGAKVSEMLGLQTNGDCNVCHTEQGTQGAPGRIVY